MKYSLSCMCLCATLEELNKCSGEKMFALQFSITPPPPFPSLVLPFFFISLFLFHLILHSHHFSLCLLSSLCEKYTTTHFTMCMCDAVQRLTRLISSAYEKCRITAVSICQESSLQYLLQI